MITRYTDGLRRGSQKWTQSNWYGANWNGTWQTGVAYDGVVMMMMDNKERVSTECPAGRMNKERVIMMLLNCTSYPNIKEIDVTQSYFHPFHFHRKSIYPSFIRRKIIPNIYRSPTYHNKHTPNVSCPSRMPILTKYQWSCCKSTSWQSSRVSRPTHLESTEPRAPSSVERGWES